jgi:hypothetical protein
MDRKSNQQRLKKLMDYSSSEDSENESLKVKTAKGNQDLPGMEDI